jgi:hypothetical protein
VSALGNRCRFIYVLAVDAEELERFVPELLEGRYPGRSRELAGAEVPGLPSLGWVLELENSVVLVRASEASNPFIWVKGGIAHAIPRSEALATHVAAGNKQLVVGRVYLAYGDDVAMAVFDETVFGAYLSLQYEPSIQDVLNRFETSLQYTEEWAKTIQEKFGGRAFTADDAYLMSL